jgi:hypothetical protein
MNVRTMNRGNNEKKSTNDQEQITCRSGMLICMCLVIRGHNLTIRIRQHIYSISLLHMYIKDENYGRNRN